MHNDLNAQSFVTAKVGGICSTRATTFVDNDPLLRSPPHYENKWAAWRVHDRDCGIVFIKPLEISKAYIHLILLISNIWLQTERHLLSRKIYTNFSLVYLEVNIEFLTTSHPTVYFRCFTSGMTKIMCTFR